ncbi:hypothetical protein FGB62_146g014 [Gracilaria domingensis]|nr:hypothetical protein FGB62_146g014 [Gracilaria domingensis]
MTLVGGSGEEEEAHGREGSDASLSGEDAALQRMKTAGGGPTHDDGASLGEREAASNLRLRIIASELEGMANHVVVVAPLRVRYELPLNADHRTMFTLYHQTCRVSTRHLLQGTRWNFDPAAPRLAEKIIFSLRRIAKDHSARDNCNCYTTGAEGVTSTAERRRLGIQFDTRGGVLAIANQNETGTRI